MTMVGECKRTPSLPISGFGKGNQSIENKPAVYLACCRCNLAIKIVYLVPQQSREEDVCTAP